MRQAELIEHNKLPRLRELDVEMDPPPPIQGHPRIIPMVNRAPLPPMGRPEAMEMGLPPPGPYCDVCFPIPNEIDKGSFQNQYDVFGRFFGPSSWSYRHLPIPPPPCNGECYDCPPFQDEASRSLEPEVRLEPSQPRSPSPSERSITKQRSVTPKQKSGVLNGRVGKFAHQKHKHKSPHPSGKTSPRPLRREIMKFEDIPAHTAKCDTCNFRNSQGMTRCGGCGWQLCQSCRQKRGGNLSHQTFSSEHAEAHDSPPHPGRTTRSTSVTPTAIQVCSPVAESPEEKAADILLRMQSSPEMGSQTSSLRVHSGASTPTTARSFSQGVSQNSIDDSEETISVSSNASGLNESIEGLSSDYVRRNPTRNARPRVRSRRH